MTMVTEPTDHEDSPGTTTTVAIELTGAIQSVIAIETMIDVDLQGAMTGTGMIMMTMIAVTEAIAETASLTATSWTLMV